MYKENDLKKMQSGYEYKAEKCRMVSAMMEGKYGKEWLNGDVQLTSNSYEDYHVIHSDQLSEKFLARYLVNCAKRRELSERSVEYAVEVIEELIKSETIDWKEVETKFSNDRNVVKYSSWWGGDACMCFGSGMKVYLVHTSTVSWLPDIEKVILEQQEKI